MVTEIVNCNINACEWVLRDIVAVVWFAMLAKPNYAMCVRIIKLRWKILPCIEINNEGWLAPKRSLRRIFFFARRKSDYPRFIVRNSSSVSRAWTGLMGPWDARLLGPGFVKTAVASGFQS